MTQPLRPSRAAAGYTALIFDLDGLLIDTESIAIAAGIEALAELGHEVEPDVLLDLVGTDHVEGHRRLVTHLGQDVDARRLDALWSAAAERRQRAGIPFKPGADELTRWAAAQGIPRAIATNSGALSAKRKLALTGLDARFETVVAFDMVENGKPAPDVYLEAARRIGVDPARALAFEDSTMGATAAVAARMTVVQIPDLIPETHVKAHFVAQSLLEGARAAGLPV